MKEYKDGNTRGVVYSPLLQMERKERREYIRKAKEAGDPVVKNICEAIKNCYRKRR